MMGFKEHQVVQGANAFSERILALRAHIRAIVRSLRDGPKTKG